MCKVPQVSTLDTPPRPQCGTLLASATFTLCPASHQQPELDSCGSPVGCVTRGWGRKDAGTLKVPLLRQAFVSADRLCGLDKWAVTQGREWVRERAQERRFWTACGCLQLPKGWEGREGE